MTSGPPEGTVFKVLSWVDKPEYTKFIPLDCEECEEESWLEIGTNGPVVMATKGMAVFFDIGNRPSNLLPGEIQCRFCKHKYVWDSEKEEAH